jgi:hypothetical protein
VKHYNHVRNKRAANAILSPLYLTAESFNANQQNMSNDLVNSIAKELLSNEALAQDLLRVRTAWEECQSNRARKAIYSYLTAVFDLVAWWAAEHRALERARRALRLAILQRLIKADEPFAAIIFGTSDQDKVDRRTRSKWSRVLRYAAQFKSQSEPLDQFVRRKGGINRCAARFTRRLGRRGAARA